MVHSIYCVSAGVSEDAFKGPFFVDTQTMTLTLKDSTLKIGNVRHFLRFKQEENDSEKSLF